VFVMPFCLCSQLATEPITYLLLNPSTLWFFLLQSLTSGARGPNMGSKVGPSVWKFCIWKNRKKEGAWWGGKGHNQIEQHMTERESYIGMFSRERNHSRNLQNLLWEEDNGSLEEHCSVSVRNSYFPAVLLLFLINNTMLCYKLCSCLSSGSQHL